MVRFQMTRIAVEQFALLSDRMPDNDISLSTELSFQYSDEGQGIACIAKFLFRADDKDVAVLVCRCEFGIHPDDAKSFVKDGEVRLPKSLLKFLALHTVGTARGILYCKTEGTPFSQMILPPINVDRMIDGEES